MIFSPTKQNAPVTIIALLLKQLKVKVNTKTIQSILVDHPAYPSLLSLSDCLTDLNIYNLSFSNLKETYSQQQFEFPFIAHSNDNGGSYMLIYDINDQHVIYGDEKHPKSYCTQEEFLTKWSGIVLLAQVTSKSGESDYFTNKLIFKFNDLKIPFLSVLVVTSVLLILDDRLINPAYSAILSIKLVGIVISIMLLVQSIDSTNTFFQNLCSLGSKNGCNSILKSDAAQFTRWLSWSEIGFFYFSGSFLSLLLDFESLSLMAYLNFLALPYTVYSILYQFRNKNWCILCCSIQALLWFEFVTNVIINGPVYAFNLKISDLRDTVLILVGFMLPIFSWYSLKPVIIKSIQVDPLKQQLRKFKFNREIFEQMLFKQPKYIVNDELLPIRLGHETAETVITIISNPYCQPCAEAHRSVDKLLDYRDDLQLRIIFITADHDDDDKTKFSRHISALASLNNPSSVKQALNDWYGSSPKKYETWAAKYPVKLDESFSSVTQRQKNWCGMAEISMTPTILINGIKLPPIYRIEELKYLV